jgi:CRISPR/Cas system-associated exonuclease Cas4 (RecB family)
MPESTLDRLRAGLHFSASALKSFLICPQKFRYHYVEGATPEFRPAPMVLGRVVHTALARLHRGLQAGQTVESQDLLQELDDALEAEANESVPIQFKTDENLDSIRQAGHQLVELYQSECRPRRILAVERPFQADLIDPRSGEVLEPKLVGVFDLVECDDEENVSVVEIKTAARRWSAGQIELDLQGSIYAEAVVQAGLVPQGQEALIRYDVLVKNKTPVLDRLYAVRRPGDREMALTIACDALRAIEAGAFYRNPGWQCSGCPFRTRCGI